ncbi:unnamed protein product [Angiostrongylus costaricensis]|uniref:ANK_REP_REGION domain-containing protein n=1 Tax=Angiostrongylus costaricensis TaxID=334426 RepID=A0A0R3PZX6_ANGCS|nr:unnamed protein product [Angiostrongylus costaricensis]
MSQIDLYVMQRRKADYVYAEPCNQEACDADTGDCKETFPVIMPGEIFVFVQAEQYYFIANIPRFLSSLSDDTALHTAVSFGLAALVRKFLQLFVTILRPVDAVDDKNRTGLMLVAVHDRVDAKAAGMLIDAGASGNYSGDSNVVSWNERTTLHFAAKYDNSQIVAFLVRKLAAIDCQD